MFTVIKRLHSLTIKRVRTAKTAPKNTVHIIQESHMVSTKPRLLVSIRPKRSIRRVTKNDTANRVIPANQILSDFLILIHSQLARYCHRQIFLPIRNSGSTKNKPQLATPITCIRSKVVNGTKWNMEAVTGM
jgi:hypothetical protein